MPEKRSDNKRITVTLEEGDREKLEEIAEHNRVKLAFVVRFAISEFLANPNRGKTLLDFSSDGIRSDQGGESNDD